MDNTSNTAEKDLPVIPSQVEGIPIKTYARLRSLAASEVRQSFGSFVEIVRGSDLRIRQLENQAEYKDFTFQKVFAIDDGQKKVSDSSAKSLLNSCMNGYNGFLILCGSIGGGKTYTLQGPERPNPDQYGLIQRVCEQLSEVLKAKRSKTRKFTIRSSSVVVTDREIVDLMAVNESSKTAVSLHTSESFEGITLRGITEKVVNLPSEMIPIFHDIISNSESQKGLARIIKLTVIEDFIDGEKPKRVFFSIHFIELSQDGLNYSLRFLDDNQRRKSPKDPLDFILNDAIGGNSQTVVIAAISPSKLSYHSTLLAVQFCEKVAQIKNYPTLNLDPLCKNKSISYQMVNPRSCFLWPIFYLFKNKVSPISGKRSISLKKNIKASKTMK